MSECVKRTCNCEKCRREEPLSQTTDWRWMRLRGYLREWLMPHQFEIAMDCLDKAAGAKREGPASSAPTRRIQCGEYDGSGTLRCQLESSHTEPHRYAPPDFPLSHTEEDKSSMATASDTPRLAEGGIFFTATEFGKFLNSQRERERRLELVLKKLALHMGAELNIIIERSIRQRSRARNRTRRYAAMIEGWLRPVRAVLSPTSSPTDAVAIPESASHGSTEGSVKGREEPLRELRATVQSWHDSNNVPSKEFHSDFVNGAKQAQRTVLLEVDRLLRLASASPAPRPEQKEKL